MSDVVVKAEGIAKKYCRTIKHTMLYGATDLFKSFIGIDQHSELLRNGEFWAVNDLSLELKKGECLGVIGPNGSGKSTLLKMLNGIFMPDKGKVEMKGRVGALIEVGAGFHPMLTGRENIYINGSILGLSKKEIDKKFDDIVDFAEIGEFIDSPVKHYSSGMYVRLGFAIAAQTEPDVLLIDEVLAVGDIGFKAKCFNTISEISKDAAIVLVSHAMPQIARICTDICVMNNGTVVYQGNDVPRGIDHYYSKFSMDRSVITGSGKASIHKIELESNGKRDIERINYLDKLTVHLYATIDKDIEHPTVHVNFFTQELQFITQCCSLYNEVLFYNKGKDTHIIVNFDKINLNPAFYYLEITITDNENMEVLIKHHAVKKLQVIGKHIGSAPVLLKGEWIVEEIH